MAVAAAILTATSLPSIPHLPHNSDKLVHLFSYALLGASVAWAAELASVRRCALWLCVVSALGAADEWHQRFIPNRRTDVRDWIADTTGAAIGLSLVTALFWRRESAA